MNRAWMRDPLRAGMEARVRGTQRLALGATLTALRVSGVGDLHQGTLARRLEEAMPLAGGGTYAQSMEEGVAFGALFPGETELAHQADEYISEESLYQNARIFARAIVRLAGEKK